MKDDSKTPSNFLNPKTDKNERLRLVAKDPEMIDGTSAFIVVNPETMNAAAFVAEESIDEETGEATFTPNFRKAIIQTIAVKTNERKTEDGHPDYYLNFKHARFSCWKLDGDSWSFRPRRTQPQKLKVSIPDF